MSTKNPASYLRSISIRVVLDMKKMTVLRKNALFRPGYLLVYTFCLILLS